MNDLVVRAHHILGHWRVGIYRTSWHELIRESVSWDKDRDHAFDKAKAKYDARQKKIQDHFDMEKALEGRLK